MKTLLISIGLFFSVLSFAQEEEYFTEEFPEGNNLELSTDIKKEKDFSTHLSLGSSFMTYSGGSGFSNYVNPDFSYKLSPKFTLNTGVYFMNSNFNNMPVFGLDGEFSTANFNKNSAFIYASGSYKVNEKLTVQGTVVKEVANLHQQKYVNPAVYNMNFQGMSFAFNYKLNDYMEIGGQVSIQEGHNPFYSNYANPFGSGFGGSTFSPYNSFSNPW